MMTHLPSPIVILWVFVFVPVLVRVYCGTSTIAAFLARSLRVCLRACCACCACYVSPRRIARIHTHPDSHLLLIFSLIREAPKLAVSKFARNSTLGVQAAAAVGFGAFLAVSAWAGVRCRYSLGGERMGG